MRIENNNAIFVFISRYYVWRHFHSQCVAINSALPLYVYSIDSSSVLLIVYLLYKWCCLVCLAIIIYTHVGGGLRAAHMIFYSFITLLLCCSFVVNRFAESVLSNSSLKNNRLSDSLRQANPDMLRALTVFRHHTVLFIT